MFKLLPPGARKGNPFYLARGRVGGELIEFSTGTTDKAQAERVAPELAVKVLADRAAKRAAKGVAGGAPATTFREAAKAYMAWRSPSLRDVGFIKALRADELGGLALADIKTAQLVAAADRLAPGQKASARNRSIITPASAVLHYAADHEWCPERRFKRFKEAGVQTRAVVPGGAATLVQAAEDPIAQALLVFLFCQGMRITDAISVTWAQLDLAAGTIEVRIGKADDWRLKALHPDARAALAGLPATPGERAAGGRVFPYANRWAAYRALNPIAIKAGVRFTPHMARHTLGKMLNAGGQGQRTIMDILDQKDPKSAIRYQSTDVAGQRAALVGIEVGKREKAK